MKTVYKILSWVVAITLPAVIVLSAVRLLMNPWYLDFEYHTPGFPEDPFGFTLQDRLKYGKIAVDYLVNDAGISYLGDLRFPAGQQAPAVSCQFMTDCNRLYNERELEHMVDVKHVVQGAMRVLTVGFVVLVVLGLWAWRGKWLYEYLGGLQWGGILVLVLLGTIILMVVFAFDAIFVLFHEIFFKAGTWTFYYSDTLIRLFPERFWEICFLAVGGVSVIIGLFFFFGARKLRYRVPN